MYWLTHMCPMHCCGLFPGRWDKCCLLWSVLSLAWDGFPPHILPLAHLDHLPVRAEVVEVIRHVDFPEPCCAAEGSRAHPPGRVRFPGHCCEQEGAPAGHRGVRTGRVCEALDYFENVAELAT